MTTQIATEPPPLADLRPTTSSASRTPGRNLTVRVGCRFVFETSQPVPIVLVVRPRPENHQVILQERLTFRGEDGAEEFPDAQGNINQRWVLPPGQTTIVHDALVRVSSLPDNFNQKTYYVPVENIPSAVLRYTLPSRYCDSDKMLSFSANQFGSIINGLDRVIAICNWVHQNIRYVTCSGRPDLSASEIMARGYGVCRDFAHVAIALCRAINLPARYVTGHLPDIGCVDPGTPMDFHAYFEVYLEHEWRTFDARYNTPRIGRVKIAHGFDAVDGSFATTYGQAVLTYFQVWAYQVNPAVVSIGDPIDLSKRLDGTPQIRFL
jgi:transglutaminase-like putative cysteine protease